MFIVYQDLDGVMIEGPLERGSSCMNHVLVRTDFAICNCAAMDETMNRNFIYVDGLTLGKACTRTLIRVCR